MKIFKRFVLLVAVSASNFLVASPLTAQPEPTLAIAFGESSIRIEGASRSGEVVWFSIASESSGYASTTVPRSGSGSADARGVATVDLEDRIPPHSIWAAVDLASGAFALATPETYPLRRSALNPEAIQADSSGRSRWLHANRSDLHLLLVRPGVGAWVGRFSDGSSDDADLETDGNLIADLGNLRPVGNTRSILEEFRGGDVLIGIDPLQMDVISFRLQD
ncbi:MAG: hypothetical protein ABI639_13570 [Thermoanaerobaculia bacterium]